MKKLNTAEEFSQNKKAKHLPVLRDEILELIDSNVLNVFDGTLGLGGHASFFLSSRDQIQYYNGYDLDAQHLSIAEDRLSSFASKMRFFEKNFSTMKDELSLPREGNSLILLDLGICSNHIDDAAKGFSFVVDGPLNMAFSHKEKNAADWINEAQEASIRVALREYGEEPKAFHIAKAIVKAREENLITTTGQLRSIIEATVPPHHHKKTLTRVFQAIRVHVNEELEHLSRWLDSCPSLLNKGDIVAIISYHSLEDKLVKKTFKTLASPVTQSTAYSHHEEVSPALFEQKTKKPILPTEEEVEQNPRARSAKLRVLKKVL